jgi:uncharacterized protein DUF4386
MRTSALQEWPPASARLGGVLYLVIIACGLFAEIFVRDRLTVSADATATARNILDHELLFRLGIAADVATFLLAVPLALILYALLRRVNEHVALLMLLFNLLQDAIGAVNALNTYEPLLFLGGAGYLKAFSPEQLEAMALLALKTHSVGFGIALLFFGCSCVALGWLIFTSGFLPRPLGVLMAVAGACYLIENLAVILFPALASLLFGVLMVPAFLGELSLALWLAAKGVDVREWRAAAAA